MEEPQKLSNFKVFIQRCKADPLILNHRSLFFFTDYLHNVGCKLPPTVYRYGDEYKSWKKYRYTSETYELDDSDEDDTEEDVLTDEDLRDLKKFIMRCKNDISFFDNPSFSFFTDYLNSFGCHKLPPAGCTCGPVGSASWDYDPDWEDLLTDDEDEMDEDDEDDSPQKMGDSSFKVTDENCDAAQEGKAMGAVSKASVDVKMKKPIAAFRDANAALQSAYVTPKKEEVLRLLKKGFLSTRDGFLSSGGSGGMLAGFHYSNAMLKVSSGDPEIMEAIQNSEFVAAIEDVVKDSANFEKYMLNPPWGPMLAKLFAPNQS